MKTIITFIKKSSNFFVKNVLLLNFRIRYPPYNHITVKPMENQICLDNEKVVFATYDLKWPWQNSGCIYWIFSRVIPNRMPILYWSLQKFHQFFPSWSPFFVWYIVWRVYWLRRPRHHNIHDYHHNIVICVRYD